MKRTALARMAVALATSVCLSAITTTAANAQCWICYYATCASGPWINSYLNCFSTPTYCLSWDCCPGSGCEEGPAAVVSMGLSGIGYYGVVGTKHTELPLDGFPGIGVARSCGGLIVSIKFEEGAADLLRRRLTRIVV